MKAIKLILVFCFMAGVVMAGEPGELTVKSSIVCDMCKTTIEEGLAYEYGIKRVAVNVLEYTLFVKYNDKKLIE